MPAVANLFFLDYLNVIRLHVGGWNTELASYLGLDDASKLDYQTISSLSANSEDQTQTGYYNELFH